MEAFVGSWKLIQDEDHDKYLKAIGVGEELIALSKAVKPAVKISQEDNIIAIKVQSGIGTEKISFKLGKEFSYHKKDGRLCKVLIDMEGNQLVQVEKWDSKEAVSTIEVKDGKLIKTTIFKDITAVQTFEKV